MSSDASEARSGTFAIPRSILLTKTLIIRFEEEHSEMVCVWGAGEYSHKSHLKRLPSLKKVFTWDWRHTTFILAQIFSQPPFVLSLLLKIYWRVGSSFNPNLLFFFSILFCQKRSVSEAGG